MIELTIRFFGGLERDFGKKHQTILIPEHTTLAELIQVLCSLGIHPHSEDYLVILNDHGLEHWQAEQEISANDRILVIPPLAGGSNL